MSALPVAQPAVSDLPAAAYAATLAGLSGMHVRRLGALLRHHAPTEAFAVVAGRFPADECVARLINDPEIGSRWRAEATPERVRRVWRRCTELSLAVLTSADPGYPAVLVNDRLPPPVLFASGDLEAFDRRRVGIVGTRNATAAGLTMATRLGVGLAEAGICVVSGLARGVDGAAHRGALRIAGSSPAGVVASGLDVVYPREHQDLWASVAERGVLISETAPGGSPEAYRFPLRNRLIAALSEVLVVVESRQRGGSLITVTEAMDRGVPVMAVPGAPGSPASVGTNGLLREGAAPVVEVDDILDMLHLDHRRAGAVIAEQRARPGRDDIAVYETCAARPGTLENIASATGRSLVDAAMAIARLEQAGWVAQADGWFETIGAPLR